MLPHPYTVCIIKDMDRRARLADAERARLAKQAGERDGRRGVGAAVRTAVGACLIRVGLLLEGRPTSAPAAETPAS